MKKHIIRLIFLATILGSCQTEIEEQTTVKEGVVPPEIIAEVESATKTFISVDSEGEGTIYWTPSDQINIFYGTTSTLYTSQNTENATTAVFRTTDIIGSTESASNNIWGLYPYDSGATCDGANVLTNLPAAQFGVPETFDDDLYITLAHSTTNALKFFNVCGGIKFSLSREDITSITFKGNNNEDIAGDISITFENDLPKATVVNGLKEVTLTPKTGESFAKNTNYYLIVLPGSLTKGFTMTFTTTDSSVGTFNYTDKAITIKRSIFSRKAAIDTYATFVGVTQPNNEIWYTSVSDEVIEPNNNNTYSGCFSPSSIVSNTVENGIGKIVFSYELTEIPTYAFYRKAYKTISLPTSVKRIGYKAFYECNSLEKVDMPQVQSIDNENFYICPKLKSITLPSSLSSIGVNCFYGCDSLEEATINTSASIDERGLAYFFNGANLKTLKGPWATQDGKYVIIDNKLVMAAGNGLDSATIPTGVTEIQPYVFYEYSSLKSVALPNTLSTLGGYAFCGCRNLDYVTIESVSVPEWHYGNEAFSDTNECPIIVPSSSVGIYKEAWSAYRVRIGSSLDDVPVLLSKEGRANCYMINAAGQYRFIANKKGNSNESIYLYTNQSPSSTSVEVLWESVYNLSNYQFSHEFGTLISSISFDDEEIIFTATGNEGNALVALRGSGGTILWSWHLWFVNEDVNTVSSDPIMDRNLGAIRSDYIDLGYTQIEAGTYGLLYQKGRKDPFVGSDSYLWDYQITTIDNSTAIKNPTTLYGSYDGTWNNYPSEWSTNKGMNDPCPPGWKIPSLSDLSGSWTFTAYNNTFPVSEVRDCDEIDDYNYNGVLFPCAGNIRIFNVDNSYRFEYERYRSWSSDDDSGFEQFGYYYLSDGYIAMEKGYNSTFDFGNYLFSYNNSDLSRAFSVRCCRE